MKPLLVVLGVLCGCGFLRAQKPTWQPSPGHTQIAIWPGAAPDPLRVKSPENEGSSGKKFLVAGRPILGVNNVTRPTMTVYAPTGKNTGAAVVVFPGGGYQTLAIDLEGTEVCDWLVPRGITCVLLKYRVTDVGGISEVGTVSRGPDGSKMRREPWGWCVCTQRSGTSIRTRSACWGSRRAVIFQLL